MIGPQKTGEKIVNLNYLNKECNPKDIVSLPFSAILTYLVQSIVKQIQLYRGTIF